MAVLDNKFIIKKFGKEKVSQRYKFLYEVLHSFIETSEFSNDLIISSPLLDKAVIDYFSDIYRLKQFHEDIEYINEIKIYAYTAYWLCRRKPIQVTKDFNSLTDSQLAQKIDLCFINEKAVATYLQSFLFNDPGDLAVVDSQKEAYKSFLENMIYFLKYRQYTAQNIETMLLSFLAGRAYQFSADVDRK